MGYEVVSLYRKDKLKWFLSTILVVANNDVKMFHALMIQVQTI